MQRRSEDASARPDPGSTERWGRPTLLHVPPDSRQVLVSYPPQGDSSAELGGPDTSVEVLIVGAAPRNIGHEGSVAGQFTSGHVRDFALDGRPMARFSMSEEKPKGFFIGKQKDSKSLWPFESLDSQWNGLKRKYYQGKDIIASYKKCPGLFEDAGIDARAVLYDDFVANSLKRIAICEDDKPLFAVGVRLLEKETVAKLLFRSKYCKSTVDLNGTRTQDENAIADTVASTLMFHDVLGPRTKVMLHIPCPYLSQKLEVSSLYRFAGFTGQISSSAPHLEVSCLLGTQLFAAGGIVQLNNENGDVDYSLGVMSRIRTFAGSFIGTNKGKVYSIEASLFKKFENEVTSIAVTASHSFEKQPWGKTSSAIIGISHEFPHSVTIKGRLSSKGIASALVKFGVWENCSLVLSTDVEVGNVQKVPKLGVLFSIL